MALTLRSLRWSVAPAAVLLALLSCQNATDPTPDPSGPVTASGSFTMGSVSRVPDSTRWKIVGGPGSDTGSQKPSCTGLTCAETVHLPHPLGADSLAVELWTLGIRSATIFFTEQANSAVLDPRQTALFDTLDTLLLGRYAKLSNTDLGAFAPLGSGPASLAAYFASLLLNQDSAFAGKPWPTGMNPDSVKKDLVYLGTHGGKPLGRLLSLNLDSATIQRAVSALIKAGLLSSSDSTTLFPPYPLQVKTPLAVADSLTPGGSPVSVTGLFAWTKGHSIQASATIRTAKPGDSANFQFPVEKFLSSGNLLDLSGNLTLQANPSASAGLDTLVVTLSDDSGNSVSSRALFRVVSSASSPTISPNGGTFYTPPSVTLASVGADSIEVSTDSSTWSTYSKALVVSASGKVWAKAFKGGAISPVSVAIFTLGTVPTPSITPNGGSFYGTDSVTIAATGADSIEVSRDSSTWTTYSKALVLSASGKVFAKAFKGGVASSVSSASFQSSAVPVPTISPNGGTFYSTQPVAVTSSTGADSIEVSADSAVWVTYTQKLQVSSSQKLYARSFKGGTPSPVVLAVFTIGTVPVPSISPNGGTFYTTQAVSVTANGADSVQTSPDSSTWVTYTQKLQVSSSQKLYVRAFKGGVASSPVLAVFSIGSVPVPSISPNGGTFYGTDTASVSAPGADSIQVSSDSATWSTYTKVIVLSSSGKVYARAFKGGGMSPVSTASFIAASVPAPSITTGNLSLTSSQTPSVSITTNIPGAHIGYSTDRVHWTSYPSAGLIVSQNEIIYAQDTVGSVVSVIDSSVFLYVPTLALSGSTPTQSTVTITPSGVGVQDSLSTGGGWANYTGPISISGNTKVYARSRLGGISTGIQEVDFAVAPTLFASPNDTGVNAANVTVVSPGADSIQTSTDQKKTWITLNGSLFPMWTGTLYARTKVGSAISSIDSVIVHLVQGAPTFSSPAGTYPVPQTISLSSVPSGASIYYTTDGTVPSSQSSPYVGPIVVGASDTIRAIAIQSGFGNSRISAASYVIPDTTGGYNPNVPYGLVKDGNGNLYRTVKIGAQTWMAQDLFNSVDSTSYFTWSQAMGLLDVCNGTVCLVDSTINYQGACPVNYHIPTNSEWNVLIQTEAGISNPALAHLSEYTWVDIDPETNLKVVGDNSSGFSMPVNSASGGPGYQYAYSTYWTANQYPSSKAGYFWAGIGSTTDLGLNTRSKSNIVAVRCLQN